MVGIEGTEIGWQENNPNEDGGGHRNKDVPGFIEIVWQFSDQETLDNTSQQQEEVVTKGN